MVYPHFTDEETEALSVKCLDQVHTIRAVDLKNELRSF